jgi:hypothetical protein
MSRKSGRMATENLIFQDLFPCMVEWSTSMANLTQVSPNSSHLTETLDKADLNGSETVWTSYINICRIMKALVLHSRQESDAN